MNLSLNEINKLLAPPDITDCRKILCIQPHPDDNEIGMGGIIASYAARGCEIHYLTITNGDLSSLDPGQSHEQIAEARVQETELAGRHLGASFFYTLGYEDGTLQDVPSLSQKIAEVIRQVQPEAVFCPDPWLNYEAHYDHIVTGRAAAHAVISSSLPSYPKGTETTPWQPAAIGFYFTSKPNTVIDITPYYEQKFHAMRLHKSQLSEEMLGLYYIYFKELGQQLAAELDFEIGEGLKVLSPLHLHCFVNAEHI
ncbi:PIG-L deacetylase family protein [Paenibacillus apis]|uniref:Diacetylchitobiose deacetylase n=1 Tax=Paenibacillus apis TaxID=1792174 RepID=A0A919Y2D2_9BACL|nr:PIG-L deacetylase family protein [Paenibacillus apis]GIO43352.1 diacetylchitobiose deacetylase [Paenibacillus apis]